MPSDNDSPLIMWLIRRLYSTAELTPATSPDTKCSASTMAVVCSDSTSSSEYSFWVLFWTVMTPRTMPERTIGTPRNE